MASVIGRPRCSGRRSRTACFVAIIVSLIVTSLYVALRFEWKFTVPVLIALMHDLLITAGVYALTGTHGQRRYRSPRCSTILG